MLAQTFLTHFTSQVWCTDHHPDQVRSSVEKTLKDLNTDYLDMLLIHYPMAYKVGCGKNATHCKVQGTYCIRSHGFIIQNSDIHECLDSFRRYLFVSLQVTSENSYTL